MKIIFWIEDLVKLWRVSGVAESEEPEGESRRATLSSNLTSSSFPSHFDMLANNKNIQKLQASSAQKASLVCNLYLTLFLVIDIVLSNVQ